MIKIALLADLHLSDMENTPQEEAFNWAIEELKCLNPDACVWLGDVTACGSPDAAMRFRKKIEALRCPSVTIVGNSDIRTVTTAPIMERFLSNYSQGLKLGDIRIVGMNTAHDRISEDERSRLMALDIKEDILLCSHQSSMHIDSDSLEFLKSWLFKLKKNENRVLAWVYGHVHIYEESNFEGIPTFSVCALDLDKNCETDAHLCLMRLDCERISVEQINYSRSTLSKWSEKERQELSDMLGITCYNKSKLERDMPFAIENRVKHLEWRGIDEGDIALLEKWRSVGGQSFSLHFPSLGLEGSEITGRKKFAEYSADAIRAGADMITVHPPYISNEIMLRSDVFCSLADTMAQTLLPVVEAGIDILVENSHTKRGTPADPLKREYGCSPLELVGWRDALTERLGEGSCYLRFDVGHARNNAPLSKEYPIGKWYSLIGKDTRSYHIHQTQMDKVENKMKNHYPITGLHDGLVSFDGFLWAWKSGVLHHGPIILEIREGEGACATWSRLQEMLKEEV